jgi:hypothetical protein
MLNIDDSLAERVPRVRVVTIRAGFSAGHKLMPQPLHSLYPVDNIRKWLGDQEVSARSVWCLTVNKRLGHGRPKVQGERAWLQNEMWDSKPSVASAFNLANEANRREPEQSRIPGEQILSGTDAFCRAEWSAKLGLNSGP